MRASAMTVSMSTLAVTHTGHPGPLTSFTQSGRMERKPLRAMATVCVPHTSIRCTVPPHSRAARGATSRMASISSRPSAGSRNAVKSSAMPAPLSARRDGAAAHAGMVGVH